MRIQAMKVYHLPRGIIWDHEPPSLTLGCKRLHPLAAVADTLSTTTTTTAPTFDLKSFIKPECSPRTARSSNAPTKESPKAESAQSGGTRWNPTQEQIGILEMHYKNGVRSPDTQLIKRITTQLSKYGKIEGKNVFYWFQNHKARERQKQKRASNIALSNSPTKPLLSSSSSSNKEEELVDNNRYKRKCMSWGFDELLEEVNKYCVEEDEEDRTLKLFPLHPEGRSSLN